MSQKVMKPVSCTQLIAWLSLLLSYGATEACPLCHLLKLPNKRSIARVGQRRHHRGCQHHNCHPRCHVAIIPTTKRPSTPTILSIQAFLPPLCVPSSNSFNGISFLQSKRIRNKNFPSKISIVSSRGCSRDDYSSSELDDVFEYRRFEECRGRHLIIFRSPSRHTYGFVNRHHENEALHTWSGCSNFDVDNINHDLAILEFNELLQSSMRSNEMGIDVKFIPVASEFTVKQSKARQDVVDDMVTPQPQPTANHSYTKANPTKQQINSPGLYWIELVDNQRISPEELHDAIHHATTRAILTHATFEIDSSIKFSRECWGDSQSNRDPGSNIDECSNQLRDVLEEKYDVIDTSNPNLSRHDRSSLIKKALIALESSESHGGELRVGEQLQQQKQRRLRVMKKIILRSAKSLDNLELSSPVFICHSLSQQEQHPPCGNDSNVKENDDTLHSIHVLHFGVRIAIGPAGTKGAPSQMLRRTHRGILKDFALKNQIRGNIISINEKSNISTAMEPEIGFLMANLALARLYNNSSIRVLDPCCGSGSLLLYSAALGATDLVGVDSDSSVWSGAFENFARFRAISGIRRRGGELPSPSLPTPKFYCGDVLDPSSTEVFCAANSFDAIVCDPPYNIGAPILLNGKDARPANYHNYDDVRSDGTDCRQPVEMNNKNDGKDLTNEVIGIARKVLRERGRIVFFIPVRSNEMTTSLADLLISRGCTRSEVDSRFSTSADSCGLESERLCLVFGRKQLFTPTFSRWLVCLEKRRGA